MKILTNTHPMAIKIAKVEALLDELKISIGSGNMLSFFDNETNAMFRLVDIETGYPGEVLTLPRQFDTERIELID